MAILPPEPIALPGPVLRQGASIGPGGPRLMCPLMSLAATASARAALASFTDLILVSRLSRPWPALAGAAGAIAAPAAAP